MPQPLRVQVLGRAVSQRDMVLAKSLIKRSVQSCFSQCVFSLLVPMFRHSLPSRNVGISLLKLPPLYKRGGK